jgi:ornithine cyclodeaminase/alanine dehydrogenase-like protein (mu-crystallin family)
MPAQPRLLTAADLKTLLPAAKDWIALMEECLRQVGSGSVAAGAFVPAFTAPGLKLPAGAGAVSALLGPDGAPRVLIDAATFSQQRDGASTALVVKHIGDSKAEVITLLGADRTGRAIIDALKVVLPNAERMLCFDPDVGKQEKFADEVMTAHDLASIIPTDPREATEGANVLVLNLPQSDKWPAPVIELSWLQTGTLIIVLHPGAGLTADTRRKADRRVTDNLAAWNAAAPSRFPDEPAPDCELSAIVAGKAPGRGPGKPLVLYFAFGSPAVDAALAAALLARAEKANRGALLPA